MFFLTLFFVGSSISSTNSGTCSAASRFRAGFVDGNEVDFLGREEVGFLAILVGVLVDLGASFFFLIGLSTLSSGRGKAMGGPKIRV